jgi:hypothetical protein
VEILLVSRGSVWNFCGLWLDSAERQGFYAKVAGIFWIGFIFEWRIWWIESIDHGLWVALVHDGPRTVEAVVAHWSSCSRPVQATGTRHEVGKTKRSSSGFSSDLHRGLDGSAMMAELRLRPEMVWAR